MSDLEQRWTIDTYRRKIVAGPKSKGPLARVDVLPVADHEAALSLEREKLERQKFITDEVGRGARNYKARAEAAESDRDIYKQRWEEAARLAITHKRAAEEAEDRADEAERLQRVAETRREVAVAVRKNLQARVSGVVEELEAKAKGATIVESWLKASEAYAEAATLLRDVQGEETSTRGGDAIATAGRNDARHAESTDVAGAGLDDGSGPETSERHAYRGEWRYTFVAETPEEAEEKWDALDAAAEQLGLNGEGGSVGRMDSADLITGSPTHRDLSGPSDVNNDPDSGQLSKAPSTEAGEEGLHCEICGVRVKSTLDDCCHRCGAENYGQPVSPEPTPLVECDPDWPCSANDHICKNRCQSETATYYPASAVHPLVEAAKRACRANAGMVNARTAREVEKATHEFDAASDQLADAVRAFNQTTKGEPCNGE